MDSNTNSKMILHCGGQRASLDELWDVPLPQATDTYHPVSHFDLVTTTARMATDLLGHKYQLRKDLHALSREGSRMFFLLQFQNGHEELGLALAGRNSYDKSMSVGFSVGASVFVCDNLALSGDLTYLRRHTPNVWDDLEMRLIRTLYRAERRFLRLVDDAEAMKARAIESEEAYWTLGLLRGRGVLSGRQMSQALKEWRRLFFHGLLEERPAQVWLAIARQAWRPKVEALPLELVHMTEAPFELGVERPEVDGAEVRVYSAAKSVVDAFKFRSRVGLEVAVEAMTRYWKRESQAPTLLRLYAEKLHMLRVMYPYFKALAEEYPREV